MKRLMIVGLLGATLTLGACGTTGNIDDTVAKVQSATAFACKFVPTVTVVAKILAALAGSPGVIDPVATAAAGICDALATAPLAEGPGRPGAYYKGVRIEGRRVR